MSALITLGQQKYVRLETRKRDGTWIGSAVSIVVADGRAYFRTYNASGKAKRMRNFPEVRVAPSTVRGTPTGPAIAGTATLLHGPEAARAAALLAGKYPLLHGRLVPAIHRRKGWTTQHYELTLEPH
ncbi:MAG TPA: PPOX class F420-dependent oxidoreductase [Actinoplanes sp.]|jgi:hypothetical protein